MQIAMVGLGRMGGNMVTRLQKGGHQCVVFDLDAKAVAEAEKDGATGASSMEDLVAKLDTPRVVWVMVPAGPITDKVVSQLGELLGEGDTVIDGGNTFFKDDIRRAKALADKGIAYLDVGTSGGVWGLERGYCLMIGGPKDAYERAQPVFETLAPGRGDIERTPGRENHPPSTSEQGYLHCGGTGAGHYVKMVHNGIEYGVMQAYAEGFDIMRHASDESLPEDQRLDIDLTEVAEVWRRGSVVGSWLLDLTAQALLEDPKLEAYSGYVADSGEGRWTVNTAIEQAVPCHVLSAALYSRVRSRQQSTFANKTLSAMRHKFGGHKEPPKTSGS
jgi:6-phosphogluconate dehydrogenase